MKIDWLRLKIDNVYISPVLSLFGVSPSDFAPSRNYYRKASFFMFADGCSLYIDSLDPSSSDTFLIDFSGLGLSHSFVDTEDLRIFCVAMVRDFDARCSRLDVAFDLVNCVYNRQSPSPSLVRDMLVAGTAVTPLRTLHFHNNITLPAGVSSDTLYIGSRQADAFIRVYDKLSKITSAGDDIPSGLDSWIRFEWEFKGDRAEFLFPAFCVGDDEQIKNTCLSYLDININRSGQVIRAPWYSDLVGDGVPARVSIPAPKPSALAREQWLRKSTSRTLAILNDSLPTLSLVDEFLQHGRIVSSDSPSLVDELLDTGRSKLRPSDFLSLGHGW